MKIPVSLKSLCLAGVLAAGGVAWAELSPSFRLGNSAYCEGRFTEAAVYYQNVLLAASRSTVPQQYKDEAAAAHQYLIRSLLYVGKVDKAREELTLFSGADERTKAILNGEILLYTGEYRQAGKIFSSLQARSTLTGDTMEMWLVYLGLGRSYLGLKNYSLAEENFRKAAVLSSRQNQSNKNIKIDSAAGEAVIMCRICANLELAHLYLIRRDRNWQNGEEFLRAAAELKESLKSEPQMSGRKRSDVSSLLRQWYEFRRNPGEMPDEFWKSGAESAVISTWFLEFSGEVVDAYQASNRRFSPAAKAFYLAAYSRKDNDLQTRRVLLYQQLLVFQDEPERFAVCLRDYKKSFAGAYGDLAGNLFEVAGKLAPGQRIALLSGVKDDADFPAAFRLGAAERLVLELSANPRTADPALLENCYSFILANEREENRLLKYGLDFSLFMEDRDFSRALAVLEGLLHGQLELPGSKAEVYHRLFRIYRRKQQREQAEFYAAKVIQTPGALPDTAAEATAYLGFSAGERGDYPLAFKYYSGIEADKQIGLPSRRAALFNSALMAQRSGDYNEAFRRFHRYAAQDQQKGREYYQAVYLAMINGEKAGVKEAVLQKLHSVLHDGKSEYGIIRRFQEIALLPSATQRISAYRELRARIAKVNEWRKYFCWVNLKLVQALLNPESISGRGHYNSRQMQEETYALLSETRNILDDKNATENLSKDENNSLQAELFLRYGDYYYFTGKYTEGLSAYRKCGSFASGRMLASADLGAILCRLNTEDGGVTFNDLSSLCANECLTDAERVRVWYRYLYDGKNIERQPAALAKFYEVLKLFLPSVQRELGKELFADVLDGMIKDGSLGRDSWEEIQKMLKSLGFSDTEITGYKVQMEQRQ